ncbi:hypothetical protein SK128_011192 [Halocaridina rubra]|uniref:Uncharacterized protein n=1 Tax=Halocaridina rubra TaxID=373956 RepID=A0AAN8ZU40_HALRR
MAGSPTATSKDHHDLTLAVWKRQEENIARLKSVPRTSVNPMKYEGENLTNIITQSYHEINLKASIGQHKFTYLPRALFTVSGKFLPCTDRSSSWLYLRSCQTKLVVICSQRMSPMTLLHCHKGK